MCAVVDAAAAFFRLKLVEVMGLTVQSLQNRSVDTDLRFDLIEYQTECLRLEK